MNILPRTCNLQVAGRNTTKHGPGLVRYGSEGVGIGGGGKGRVVLESIFRSVINMPTPQRHLTQIIGEATIGAPVESQVDKTEEIFNSMRLIAGNLKMQAVTGELT